MGFIYHIFTVPETKHYIGQETYEGRRWKRELREALAGDDRQPKLFSWIRKYSKIPGYKFCRETIESISDKSVLDQREIFWIDFFRKKFGEENVTNIRLGGSGATSEEISKMQKLAWKNPEIRARRTLAIKNSLAKPGVLEARTKAIKAGLATEASKKKRSLSAKEVASRPDVVEKKRIAMKAIWSKRKGGLS